MLGLLGAAAMLSAFTNTLFTQTVHKAAEDFDIGKTGQGIAGAVVRAGILITLPFAFRADRIGRRRVILWLAVAAPVVCALGALAPTFPVLVGTQTIGRPLGLALDLLLAVVAAEEADEVYFVLVHDGVSVWLNFPILLGSLNSEEGPAPKCRSSAFTEGPEGKP